MSIKIHKNCMNCKWLTQGKSSLHCGHKDAIKYYPIEKRCKCGRTPNKKYGGCGLCIGRGLYVYHTVYADCDIDKFEKNESNGNN